MGRGPASPDAGLGLASTPLAGLGGVVVAVSNAINETSPLYTLSYELERGGSEGGGASPGREPPSADAPAITVGGGGVGGGGGGEGEGGDRYRGDAQLSLPSFRSVVRPLEF